MDKKELLNQWIAQLAEVKLKLKMVSFLKKQGVRVDEEEMDGLLDRYRNLKKLIEELKKN
ncbi:hypothetical protein MWN41_11060 [Ornithobacterium rhinotracheale]|uniref:hypothetical protein n=1 Tax=Ornithobacterium rhinotracheale TaxID=28251 RepID=UPI00129C7180|nr:hypothetical protein [Ornithobacterium rhinotracheale]MCK0203552.1 hypothetical protein [Ornithobacterium rhinotracheale]MRI64177.1 hypothetical protein [Ornithobacterium rhinotracheale]